MDDIQRLILETVGEEKLVALTKALGDEKEVLKQLATEFRTGVIQRQAFDVASEASAQKVIALNQKIGELDRGARVGGQGLMQLQYMLDDLVNTSGSWERHLSSISNNIPGLVMSAKEMGGIGEKIAAWAGPIGLVSTALIALAPLARQVWETMTETGPKEALDEIADAAKRVQDELRKIRQSRPEGEAETQKGFEDLFALSGGKQIQGGIAGALTATGRGEQMTEQEQAVASMTDAQIDASVDADVAYQGQGARAGAEKKAALKAQRDAAAATARDRVNRANVERAGKLLGRAPMERGARDTIRGLAAASPGNFPRGFAGDMMSMEPDVLAEVDAENEAFDEQMRQRAEAGQKARASARGRAKAAKEAAAAKARTDREVEQAEANAASGAREIEAAEAREARAAQHAAAQAERRAPIDESARQIRNFNDRAGGGLNDSQIQAAAGEAVNMVRQGADVNDALLAAFQHQIDQMQALQQRLQTQAARARNLGMGPDQSGQFSQMTPMWGF